MILRALFILTLLIQSVAASSQNCVAPHWVKKYGGSQADGIDQLLPDSARLSFSSAGYYGTNFPIGPFTLTNPAGSGVYVARFDTAGNVLMAATAGYCAGTIADRIQIWNVANDRSGNIYITGYYKGSVNIGGQSLSAATERAFIAKYNPTGTMAWITSPQSTFPTVFYDIAVDSNLNVYAVGYFSHTQLIIGNDTLQNFNITIGFEDMLITALDSTGQFIWARHAGNSQNDGGSRIACNNQGDLFVIASVRTGPAFFPPGCSVPIAGNANYNLVLVRYDAASGDAEWAGSLASPSGNQNISAADIMCDDAGGCYLTGSYSGYCYFPPLSLPLPPNSAEFYLARFNHDGSCAWVRTGGAFNSTDEGYAMDYYNGKISVCGKLSNFNPVFSNFMLPGSYTMFTAVYDSSGVLQWMRGAASTTACSSQGTAFDVDGTVYTAGIFSGTQSWPPVSATPTASSDGFIVKYKQFSSPTPVANAGPDRFTNCGASVQLTGSVTPSVGTTYGWTPNYNLSSVTSLTPNAYPGTTSTYFLNAINAGCADVDTVVVTVNNNTMTASAGNDIGFCVGDSVQLSASCNTPGATVAWLPAAGLSATNIPNPWAKPVQTTTYIVTFTSVSCIVRDTVVVHVNPVPVMLLASSYNICIGNSQSITCGNPSYNTVYTWTPSSGLNTSIGPSVVASPTVTTNYSVTAVNQYGCTASGTTTVVVTPLHAAPTFTLQPVSTTICAGNNLVILAQMTATGPLYYRWEMNTGSGFVPVPATAPYSNTWGAGLSITPVSAAMSGTQYRCRGFTSCSPTTYSNVVTLTVTGSPVITVQPPNRSICPAQNTTFPVTANGSGNAYLWQVDQGSGFVNLVNGAPYSGVTTATLTITGASAMMNNYQYRCRITGCTPSAISYSSPGILNVGQAPIVISPPANDTICENTGTSFTFTNTGGTSYVWQVNTGSGFVNLTNVFPYSGVTTPTLIITSATIGMNGYQYRCLINGGCSTQTTSAAATLSVLAPPATSLVLPTDTTCISSVAFALTGGSPSGGTWSGNGVVAGMFAPAIAGAGTHTITYSVSNVACSSSAVATIFVAAPVSISFSSDTLHCINEQATVLSANPAGGLFSGIGVSANLFDPAVSGIGQFPVNYSYFNGCVSADSFNVSVVGLPVITVSSFGSYCATAGLVTLSGASPSGGVYSGIGVSNGNFDPAIAGAGTHFINYSYTDSNGCTGTNGDSIHVSASPVVTMTSPGSLCVDEMPIVLNSGSPSGGTYSGNGVSGGMFDPAVAGAGVHYIIYAYTDSVGCAGSSGDSVYVNALPTVNLNAPGIVCIDSSPITLTGGSPAGGIYAGPGVSGGNFDPAATGVGTFAITYTFTDGAGCTAMAADSVVVDLCLGVSPIQTSASFTLSPVPASDVLNLNYTSELSGTLTIQVVDVQGKVIQESNVAYTTGTNCYAINITALASGVYMIRTITEEATLQRKAEVSR